MSKRLKSDVALRCEYLDATPGLGWAIKVSFIKLIGGFEVWASERNAHVSDSSWRLVSTVEGQTLDWRSVAKFLLDQDDLHVWGDLWERVVVDGLDESESDMVLMAFIIDDEIPSSYQRLVRFMIGFTDDEIKEFLDRYGNPINLVHSFRDSTDDLHLESWASHKEMLALIFEKWEDFGLQGQPLSVIKSKIGVDSNAELSELLTRSVELATTTAVDAVEFGQSAEAASDERVSSFNTSELALDSDWQRMLRGQQASRLQARDLILRISQGQVFPSGLIYGHQNGWWAIVVWLFQSPDVIYVELKELLKSDQLACVRFMEQILSESSSSVSLFTGDMPHRFGGGAAAIVGQNLVQRRVLAGIYCQRIADQLGITFPAFLRIGNLPHWGKPSDSLEVARGFLGNREA